MAGEVAVAEAGRVMELELDIVVEFADDIVVADEADTDVVFDAFLEDLIDGAVVTELRDIVEIGTESVFDIEVDIVLLAEIGVGLYFGAAVCFGAVHQIEGLEDLVLELAIAYLVLKQEFAATISDSVSYVAQLVRSFARNCSLSSSSDVYDQSQLDER